MRADAQRSYQRILVAATEVFAEQGIEASLNEVARRAQVGPATLYRHFPARDDLLDVLMSDWNQEVAAAAREACAQDLAGRDLLTSWCEGVIRLLSVHRGGPLRIVAALDDPASPVASKARGLVSATAMVLERLRGKAELRQNVTAAQVCQLVAGLAATTEHMSTSQAELSSLLTIITDGLLLPRQEQLVHDGRG